MTLYFSKISGILANYTSLTLDSEGYLLQESVLEYLYAHAATLEVVHGLIEQVIKLFSSSCKEIKLSNKNCTKSRSVLIYEGNFWFYKLIYEPDNMLKTIYFKYLQKFKSFE